MIMSPYYDPTADPAKVSSNVTLSDSKGEINSTYRNRSMKCLNALTLHILLHYHIFPTQYSEDDPAHLESSSVSSAMRSLIDGGMIAPSKPDPKVFTTTEKGRCFVEYIVALQWPESHWKMKG